MADYIAHVRSLHISIREKIPESEVVLTVIGGLGVGYESLVTSLTTKLDHSMMFVNLQAILMDHELGVDLDTLAPIAANVVVVTLPIRRQQTLTRFRVRFMRGRAMGL